MTGSARGIRGYSVDGLLVIDEAAFVGDDVWAAAWPLVKDPPPEWCCLRVTGAEAGTIDLAFLERVRASQPPELFAQEYLAEFGSGINGTGLFPAQALEALFEEAG